MTKKMMTHALVLILLAGFAGNLSPITAAVDTIKDSKIQINSTVSRYRPISTGLYVG